jgi:hypothetical protein
VINGTCLGKGERTRIAPLELILLHLIGMGYYADCRPDFTVLNELAELYTRMGQPVADKYPLYGRDAHRTRAGIHADGINKFWSMYAPFNVPELIGRPLEVSLSKDSGIAGLIFVARQHLGRKFSKDDPGIQAAHRLLRDKTRLIVPNSRRGQRSDQIESASSRPEDKHSAFNVQRGCSPFTGSIGTSIPLTRRHADTFSQTGGFRRSSIEGWKPIGWPGSLTR